MILLAGPLISATIDFDDWKTYDNKNKEYTITQLFGLGKEIGKVKLNSKSEEFIGIGYQKRSADTSRSLSSPDAVDPDFALLNPSKTLF